MSSDRTRTSDDPRLRYKAVVMQQGRVTLDRDFNALQEIVDGQIAADALDVIGPCGSPDDGFSISLPDDVSSASIPSSQPEPEPGDFLIAPGTMYVGGQRVVLPAPGLNQPEWSYFHQPDWINPAIPAAFSGASQSTPPNEYVYLHVYEQEVSAVEDSDLLDVALGGPDTTQRVRLMWRVIRMPVVATDCSTALSQAQQDWAAKGFKLDPSTMRRLPQAALQVTFPSTSAVSTPCDPVAQSGYLGAENQLIRLQINEFTGGTRQLLWGYDDASSLYQASLQVGSQNTLNLTQLPVDAFHSPTSNQVVEVLRTAAVLAIEPDATVSTGSQTTVGYVAEATGFVTTVFSYNNTANTVTLSSNLPAPYLSDTNPLFLRIWQGQQQINLSSQPMPLTDPTTGTSLGIQVTITVPTGGPTGAALPVGAYWMIAVRPSTPQAVYPQRFLNAPQLPDGPRQWICPLAVIAWAGGPSASVPSFSSPSAKITPCRQQFASLTKLSNTPAVNPPPSGCCTITVRPADSGMLQDILDTAVAGRQPATVCLMPGTYSLPKPLRLTRDHSDIVLHGPQGGVTIQAHDNAKLGPFQEGLVILLGADRVTLRGLTFVPKGVAFTPHSHLPTQFRVASHNQLDFIALIALRPVDCLELTVEDCNIEFPALSLSHSHMVFAAGLFVAGDCTGLDVHGCRFESKTHPTLTHIEMEERTESDSIDLAIRRRSTGPIVAAFGVLATTPFSSDSHHRGAKTGGLPRTALDDTSIRANRFSNLTIPVFVHALDLGTVQIQDNIVRNSLCGFWLFTASLPSCLNSNASTMIDQASKFWEIQVGSVMGREYPLPNVSDNSQSHRAPAVHEESAKSASTLSSAHAWTLPMLREALMELKPLEHRDATEAMKAHSKTSTVRIVNNDIQALPDVPTMSGSMALLAVVSGTTGCDLRLMHSVNDVTGIPKKGKSLVVVAVVDHVLHLRIFDGDGKVVVDSDEKRLREQTQQIADLRKHLESLWHRQPHELTHREKGGVIAAVTSIVNHTQTLVGSGGSLIVNSNNVRGRTFTSQEWTIPVAILAVDCPTTVTGNLIIDESLIHDRHRVRRVSLHIFMPCDDASGLAVTGNVLVGENNLADLTRSDLTPSDLTTWKTLNSTRNQ